MALKVNTVPVVDNENSLANFVLNSSTFIDKGQIVASAPTGTINFDALTYNVVYYTTVPSANWTINFRGDASTTLNSVLPVNSSISLNFIARRTNSNYFLNNLIQIDGTTISNIYIENGVSTWNTRYLFNTYDVYAFTIIKTASAQYTVLLSRTEY